MTTAAQREARRAYRERGKAKKGRPRKVQQYKHPVGMSILGKVYEPRPVTLPELKFQRDEFTLDATQAAALSELCWIAEHGTTIRSTI